MAEVYCGSEPCPLFLNSTCVFYTGESLLYIGVQTNDTLEAIIVKINQAFQNTGIGYAFTNGVIQPTPSQPVQLGGALIQNTTIGGNFTLTFSGNVQAAKHITTGGSSSQFVKGDGTLDSTAYQPAANYITGLSGDVLASGPGVAAATLATVNFSSGTFGNGNTIPIVTVNSKGLVTNITPIPVTIPPLPITFIGDVVGSGSTGSNITLLLQNVNPNIYNTITPLKFSVNGKGLVTSASPITASDIVNILGFNPSGTAGSSGTSGTTGTSGTSGTSGIDGTFGTSGTSGTSGSSATSGTSGTSGSSGTAGTSGSTGTSGSSGTTGTSGSSGTTGTSGSSGTSGTTGTSGSSGTSGTTGTSGSSGLSGDRFKTTSTTTYTLQAPGNPGTLTVDPGLSYTVAQSIIIAFDANNHNEAEVTSYNPLTGVINFVTFTLTGSGTYSSWFVNIDGASGGDGSSGTSGTTGTSGSSGTSGTTGTSGSSGTSGTTGTSGSSGTSGTSATDGTGGTSGTSGSSATSGTSGTSGTSATSGTSGTSATSGTTGTSGTSGTNGTGGTSGTSGTSGVNGTSGTSGVNGTSGTSGTTPVNQVTGTGTPNYLPKFTGASTIGNSIVQDNGSTITVGGSVNLTASTSFPTVGFLNRTSDSTLYIVSPTSGFAITDNSLNTIYNGTPTAHNWNISNALKMTLSSSGNLLIGSPPAADNGARLQVSGTATFSGSVTASDLIISDTYANDPLIKLASTTSGNAEVQIRTATTTYNPGIGVVTSGYDFNLFTNNTPRLTISSTGAATFNLGSGEMRLNRTGTSEFLKLNTYYLLSDGNDQLLGSVTGATSIYAGNGVSPRLTITSSGNVGIGTTAPISTNLNSALTIYKVYNNDSSSIPSPNAQLYGNNQSGLYLFGRNSGLTIVGANNEENQIIFANSSTVAYASINTGTGSNSTGGDMYFKVGSNTERMRITSGGNVELKIPSSTTQGILFKDIGGTSRGKLYYGDISGEMYFGTMTGYSTVFITNDTEKMRITSSGNVGLGVTPNAWASAYAVMQYKGGFVGTSAGSFMYFGQNCYSDGSFKYVANGFASNYAQDAGDHIFYTAPSGTAGNAITFTPRMTITSGGNVLIGTSTDNGYKLKVNGGTQASSFNTDSGTTLISTFSVGYTTFYTVSNYQNAIYLVTLQLNGYSNYTAYATICQNDSGLVIMNQVNNVAYIQVSGLNIQGSQNSGAPQNMVWKIIKIN